MRALGLLLVILAAWSAPGPALRAQAADAGLSHSITAPFDYADPRSGQAQLTYELGAPFDPKKPTVIVVADGQQFFVRPGAAGALQQQLFGPGVNVVGLITRGMTPAFIDAAIGPDGKPDWLRAWRIFNARQWVEDIDSVRRAVVGDGQVMLYGRSGGAYLVHQYLSLHSDHVSRAFTQSPVNPFIVRDLGIGIDRFWGTLGREQPQLQPVLQAALKRRPDERIAMLLTLQRQHFYVPAEKLAAEREALIRAFDADDAAYAAFRKAYEVDGVLALMGSKQAIPQLVRVVELLQPTGAFDAAPDADVSPLIEPQRAFAQPLLELVRAGKIAPPPFDLDALHRAPTEVFVLAGREDEAVDYRTSIALAYSYRRHVLFIAGADNHNFAHMEQSGMTARLVQAFLEGGAGSPRLSAALAEAAPDRWAEN